MPKFDPSKITSYTIFLLDSELEEIESEMYKKSYLNMRINDLIDMNAVKDQFEKKIMLGDANTAERLLQLHPGIQEDTHFISAMVYQAASSKSISCLKTLFRIGRLLVD